MPISGLTALSTFTDKAPVSPTYMNAKWAEVQANFDTIAASAARDFWVNVKAYGAKGDGITDDTSAIRTAISAAQTQINSASIYSSRGAILYFPAGDYKVTGTLTLVRGMTVLGDGSEVTQVRMTGTSGDVFYYTRPDATLSLLPAITLKGFRVTAPSDNSHTSGAGIHIDSDDTTPSKGSRLIMEDVVVYYCYEGCRIRNIQGGHIRACSANYSGSSNWIFRGFQTLLTVEGCWSSAAASNGWDISGASYCTFTGCGSDSNGGHGWYVKRQAGDQSMQGNHWVIGSEGSVTSLFTFDTVNGNTIVCFGIAKASGGTTTDGLVLASCTGCVVTPWITTETTATGYPLNVTGGGTTTNLTINGGFIGFYAAGVNQATGMEYVTFLNYQSGNLFSVGGQIATTSVPTFPFGVVRRTNAAAAASQVIGDLRYVATTNEGSAIFRIGADNGTSFAQLEHNSSVGAPFTWGTFGDAILRATAGRVMVVSSGATVSVASTGFATWMVPSLQTAGTSLQPSIAFSSESSLGFYRSGVSTLAPSYGTVNLASNSVRLSMRTIAAASLDSTTLAVNEVAFSVGGASGASLAIRSGGTVWYFSSSASTVG